MSTSAQAAAPGSAAAKLGFTAGQVIQEFGYDDDVDDDLRFAIEDLTTTELEDEDYADVADAVMIWWRDDDGDLVDTVVDALTNLADHGFIVVLTPKAGRSQPRRRQRHRGGRHDGGPAHLGHGQRLRGLDGHQAGRPQIGASLTLLADWPA